MAYQTTIASNIKYTGIGLHSGKPVHMELYPLQAGEGIVFQRSDLPGQPRVKAIAENVTSTLRATTIEDNGIKLFTIEHLMAALHGYGIDNCLICLDSEEPPVADGSSRLFSELLLKAGKKELEAEKEILKVDRLLRVDDGDRYILALPYDGLRISFTSINPHPLIGIQYMDLEVSSESFLKEIAPARTIAYEAEIEALQKMGLGLGGSLENVIVYNDNGWINDLFFKDELVRHKVLDLMGDLRLAGNVQGHFVAVKSGHAINTAMAKLLRQELINK